MLHFGKVEADGWLEQVKGVTYHLDRFLGTNLEGVSAEGPNDGLGSARHLYHIVLYLAPGDYHHFHSPVNWNLNHRRHFPGNAIMVTMHSLGVVSRAWVRDLSYHAPTLFRRIEEGASIS